MAACPLTKTKLVDITRRLRVRNDQMRQRDCKGNSNGNIFLSCVRDPFFSWEEVSDNLADIAVGSVEPLRPLTHEQAENCLELLQSSNATTMSEIMTMIGAEGKASSDHPFYLSVVRQLLSLFPLMSVTRVRPTVCSSQHELLLTTFTR